MDPTPKQIYSAEVRYSKRRHTNCSLPHNNNVTTPTTTYTVLGPDGFAAGKKETISGKTSKLPTWNSDCLVGFEYETVPLSTKVMSLTPQPRRHRDTLQPRVPEPSRRQRVRERASCNFQTFFKIGNNLWMATTTKDLHKGKTTTSTTCLVHPPTTRQLSPTLVFYKIVSVPGPAQAPASTSWAWGSCCWTTPPAPAGPSGSACLPGGGPAGPWRSSPSLGGE